MSDNPLLDERYYHMGPYGPEEHSDSCVCPKAPFNAHVVNLRTIIENPTHYNSKVLAMAADEIERLQRELAEAQLDERKACIALLEVYTHPNVQVTEALQEIRKRGAP